MLTNDSQNIESIYNDNVKRLRDMIPKVGESTGFSNTNFTTLSTTRWGTNGIYSDGGFIKLDSVSSKNNSSCEFMSTYKDNYYLIMSSDVTQAKLELISVGENRYAVFITTDNGKVHYCRSDYYPLHSKIYLGINDYGSHFTIYFEALANYVGTTVSGSNESFIALDSGDGVTFNKYHIGPELVMSTLYDKLVDAVDLNSRFDLAGDQFVYVGNVSDVKHVIKHVG